MSDVSAKEDFLQQISRGREFEKWEREQWKEGSNSAAKFERRTQWKGRRGRIDIFLDDLEDQHTVIVEIKATDWDSMKPYRVRPNALRHARQIWRYIESELENQPVLPALVYPKSPRSVVRKREIEKILNDRLIQVVWRDERAESA